MAAPENEPEEIGPFQLVVLLLSLLVLTTAVLDTTLKLPHEISTLLHDIDDVVCVVLLADFLIRFRKAPSKLAFMKWGWIDLLASIPAIEALRLGRLIRIIRVLRLLRGVRLIHRLMAATFRNKMKGGIAAASLAVFLLLCFSSISILICEQDPHSNIKTAEDAIWWSMSTVTTVGYGDRYPVTTEGRLVAVILMLSGLGLFGTISGLTAAMYMGTPEKNDATLELTKEVQQLRAEIALLRTHPPAQAGASAQAASRTAPLLNTTGPN
ncbi:MAG TPA: ion transporter [Lacunisphaera sp.]